MWSLSAPIEYISSACCCRFTITIKSQFAIMARTYQIETQRGRECVGRVGVGGLMTCGSLYTVRRSIHAPTLPPFYCHVGGLFTNGRWFLKTLRCILWVWTA